MNELTVGNPYSRKELANLFDDQRISSSREGIFYTSTNKTIIFVTLDKSKKTREDLKYNDFFENDLFHWDSQTRQHIETPRIAQLVSGDVNIYLFVRVEEKNKSKTNPFIYCGELEYLSHDALTNKPVHIIFQLINYEKNPSVELEKVYSWKPTGKKLTTVKPISSQIRLRSSQKRTLSGQGYMTDQENKKAIELKAMESAKIHYEQLGYEVVDISLVKKESIDLKCIKGAEVRYVEVKGTTTDGAEVFLTANEVIRAQSGSFITDLFILHSIKLVKKPDAVEAVGGVSEIYKDWFPNEDMLIPLQYKYLIKK
jgi:hypothetical protein